MKPSVEVARSTLAAMGSAAERIDAAAAALEEPQEQVRCRQDDEPLLTPAEIRGRLKISATSLWRMKGLPVVRVGGRKRYLWSEVRGYLASHEKAGQA